MGLERATLVAVERPGGEPADGDTAQPIAEHEVLGEPVARGEQRLLDLRGCEAELGRGLVDAEPVQPHGGRRRAAGGRAATPVQ